jgi:hypothetical protein
LVNQNVGLGKHPWAKTPNDGEHHLFQWHESFARKSTKLCENSALEVLGGPDNSFPGFIVVFPSVVKTEDNKYRQYQWQVHPQDCNRPPFPDWLAKEFEVNDKVEPGRGNEEVNDGDLGPNVSTDQIRRMLSAIDPDRLSYDQWLSVGMAIHSQHSDALKLWDDWSQSGDRYKPDECRKRWKGFRSDGTSNGRVTIATVFYHATNAGWQPEQDDVVLDPVSTVIINLNHRYGYLVVGGKERILRQFEHHDPNDLPFDLITKGAFNGLLANQLIYVPSVKKHKKLADVWLNHPLRRTYPRGLGLYPSGDVPPGAFNTWNGFAVEPRPGSCDLFLGHLYVGLCRGEIAHYEFLLDWLADLVQDPANPKGCAIVMRGPEGSGKGTLANTIGKLFGPHYIHLIDEKHLTGNFNAHMMEAIVVFADEITWGGHVKTSGKLKGLVTEDLLLGERKGIDAIRYRNHAHLIVASNSDWVIPAGSSSRRWFVLDVDGEMANNRSHFDEIYEELRNGGDSALLNFLLEREITRDLRIAPETQALSEQRQLSAGSRDRFYDWILNLLNDGQLPGWWTKKHANHRWCVQKKSVYDNYVREVRELGGHPLGESMFWTQWLRVFPWSKGSGTNWPRTRDGQSQVRLAIIRSRNRMCDDFTKFYGVARNVIDSPDDEWNSNED